MKNIIQILTLLMVSVFIMTSCECTCGADEIAEKEQAIKDDYNKVMAMFESGNTEGIENYVQADMIEHTPWPGIEGEGIEWLKNAIKAQYAGMPDTKITIYNVSVDGDYLYAHYNMKGTHSNEGWPGMPATGKTIDVDGVDILKYKDGKASEHWGYADQIKMMTQLGLMPEEGAEAPSDSTATAAN